MATTNLTHSTIPEVNAYFVAHEIAFAALREAEREAVNANPLPVYYSPEYRAANHKRQAAIDAAWDAFNGASHAAKQHLRNSDNPLIAWVADNVSSSHTDELHAFLRALPLTREELDNFRYTQGWCSTYTNYLDRAAEDGVLPPYNTVQFDLSAIREDLDEFSENSIHTIMMSLRKHLPQIIADYNTDVAKAQEQESK